MCFVFSSMLKHCNDSKAELLASSLCLELNNTIPFGVAFHNSDLTVYSRKLIEAAYHNKMLCVIICTSTLAADVNLPAK